MASAVVSRVGGAKGEPFIRERIAAAAGILPCHLVKESGSTIAVNNDNGTKAQPLFVQLKASVGGDINTAYASGETVRYGVYHTGQEVTALVAAGALAITDGTPLTSAGDGTLKVGTPDNAVAYALQDVDNSGGSAAVQIHARVA